MNSFLIFFNFLDVAKSAAAAAMVSTGTGGGGVGGNLMSCSNVGGGSSSSHFGRKSRQRERRLGFNWDFLMMDRVASFDEGDAYAENDNASFTGAGGGGGTDNASTSSTKRPGGQHGSSNKSPSTSTRSKFSRIAANIANKRRGGAKWRALIEATRNKVVIPFSRSQDSVDSDATLGGGLVPASGGKTGGNGDTNTDSSNPALNESSSRLSTMTKLDADLRRQIYALKLESVSLSQPALQSSAISSALSGSGGSKQAPKTTALSTIATKSSSTSAKQEAINAVQTKVLSSDKRSANVLGPGSGGAGGGGGSGGVSGGTSGSGSNASGSAKMPCDIITMKANDWI